MYTAFMRKGPTVKPLRDRLMSKIAIDSETGCWNFTGCRDKKGYGSIRSQDTGPGTGKRTKAHRASYEVHFGPIPEGEGYHGTCVCHSCDNPSCVNPEHLFLGTVGDNVRDMFAKGRRSQSAGYNAAAKLNPDSVREIRRLHAAGHSAEQLSHRFGVTAVNIRLIVRRKTWADVE